MPGEGAGWLARPGEVVWWLQDAELVIVWVGEYVPPRRVFVERFCGEKTGAKVENAADLGVQVAGAEVKVEPSLSGLYLGDAL